MAAPARNQSGQTQQQQQQQAAAAADGKAAAKAADNPFPHIALPGLGPDPNPKVQVRNVNPPITPDQVVSQVEAPSVSLPDLPKIQNIKIPAVKNKTIQGHLKAIEAKMNATEKLMKDIVKLQKVQIHTEKELHERRRELYQNTLEEYLYDKTVDFKNPKISEELQKLGKKRGGGGFGFPPGFLPPNPNPNPSRNPQTNPSTSPSSDAAAAPEPDPDPTRNPTPDTTEPPTVVQPVPKRDEEPGFQVPNVFEWLKLIPFGIQDLLRNQPIGSAQRNEEFLRGEPGTPSYSPTPDNTYLQTLANSFNPAEQKSLYELIPGSDSFANLIGQDPKMMSQSFDMASMLVGGGFGSQTTNIVTNPAVLQMAQRSPAIAKLFGLTPAAVPVTGSASIAKQRLLSPGGLLPRLSVPQAAKTSPFPSISTADRLRNARMIQAASSRGPLGGYTDPIAGGSVDNIFSQNLFQQGQSKIIPFPIKPVPFQGSGTKIFSNMGLSDDAIEALYTNPNRLKLLSDLDADNLSTAAELNSFTTPQGQSAMRDALRDMGSSAEEVFKKTPGANVTPELNGVTTITNKATPRAAGGMGSTDLHNSGAKEYFRKVSSTMVIPKFSGGGFNLLNPMSWFSGDLKKAQEGELENVSNDTFAGKLYNRRKQQEEMMRKLRGYQIGGIVDWWNKGRNMRVPSENTATWKDLMADDARQLTRTDRAFKSGSGGIKGWRPLKAFTPEMVRTGPTPAVRQVFERPVRAVGRGINPSSAVNPLALLTELIINELVNPAPTSSFDQVTGPNAYYNMPGYKGPMPSQSLENAQGSMISGSDNQQPQVMPLPPDYIQIPGKTPTKNNSTFIVPGIDKPTSMFTRPSTIID